MKKFSIAIPENLHAELKSVCNEKGSKSLNFLIVQILSDYVRTYEVEKSKPKKDILLEGDRPIDLKAMVEQKKTYTMRVKDGRLLIRDN